MKTSGKEIKIRTIFIGTSEFADEILKSLLSAGYNIISVYTKPDRKAGREHKIEKSFVKITAESNKIPVFQPEKLDENAIAEISAQKPDLIIVAAYGKIIPKAILKIPGFGVLNVHGSLLPKYRGPSPIQNALLNNEVETGATIMLMDEGVDTGEILSQEIVKIEKDETAVELSAKLAKVSAGLLLETVPFWIERKIEPKKQDDSAATLCQLIEKEDGRIFWTDEAEAIYNRFRAFQPWPGVFTFWENEDSFRRINLTKINVLKNNPEAKHHIGEVFQIGEKIGVQTTLGIVILEEVQIEGKPKVKIEEFVNGYQNFVGSILK